ncbi:hypothetical protein PHYSODRAFT_495671 [Phytophthora sojae]|uniref:Zinc/iron permease n=1 Tax=Phytophthora sojae (strain P6497) TaxID=1094619 RepID=G4Z3J3_PHYSP|nr:hypothetical protein PHYSODRAFT_495671 [Phytophthora sojae]EGZ19365.1 hypothetical protein PHYSODRAFT_495671 [Phytophthora sojae]|eukprot:XP_009522082.1 hypothetical protein PHYSODRAFT_495671 [Phytophthora sojae]
MALSTTLSVSGGVTVFMSLVILFGFSSWLAATVCLGVGILIVYAVDLVVQKLTPGQGFVKMDEAAKQKLQLMGILSGIAIALHNIPSGIATFTAGLEDPAFGLPMAIGVGLHNMAEGVAVAAPVYFATGSKWKGIMWCIIAAVAEHIGAFIALLIVGKEVRDFAQATLYGIVAGMMSTITMKEIFPTAYTYANGRIYLVSNGGLAGMILMALSLSFFKHVGVGK